MTTTTMAVPRVEPTPPPPPAASKSPTAVRDQRYRTMQLVLFTVGALLMPFGIVAICLGWYGTAHSHYTYDQSTYLISGGILGLGLTFLGGFLYFGAWLAKMGADQRDSAKQLADTMLVLADLVSRQSANGVPVAYGSGYGTAYGSAAGPVGYEPGTDYQPGGADPVDPGAVLVLAGAGTTVHRRDCALIAHRDDLQIYSGQGDEVTTCRVCRPTLAD